MNSPIKNLQTVIPDGNATFNSITVSGTSYAPSSPIVIKQANIPSIQNFLNTIPGIFGNVWSVLYEALPGATGFFIFKITGASRNSTTNNATSVNLTISSQVYNLSFTDTAMISANCNTTQYTDTLKIPVNDYFINVEVSSPQITAMNEHGGNLVALLYLYNLPGGVQGTGNAIPVNIPYSNYNDFLTKMDAMMASFGWIKNSLLAYSYLKCPILWSNQPNCIDISINLSGDITANVTSNNAQNLDYDNIASGIGIAPYTVTVNGATKTLTGSATTSAALVTALNSNPLNQWDAWTYNRPSASNVSSISPYQHTNLFANFTIGTLSASNELVINESSAPVFSLIEKISATWSCVNGKCLLFSDKTQAQTQPFNTNGYGAGYPAISDIVSVTFNLYDNSHTLLGTYSGSGYLPVADGSSQICLTPADFGISDFVPGAIYQLDYVLSLDNGVDDNINCGSFKFIGICCPTGSPNTGLEPTFKISMVPGCGTVTFEDNTGAYNPSTNPGGYGAPNPDYSDIDYVIILVTRPDGTMAVINTDYLPNGSNSVSLTPAMFGYSGSIIPDGVYNISYYIFDDNGCVLGIDTIGVLFYCQTQTCIESRGLQILNEKCNCSDDKSVANYYVLKYQLDVLKRASVGGINCVNTDIQTLLANCQKECSDCI